MKKILKRVFKITFLTILGGILTIVIIILFPQQLFAKKISYKKFTVYSNENVDNNIFLGAAYHHFNHPKNSFYRNPNVELDPKWVGSAGIKFSVTPSSYLTIQADYSKQGKFNEIVAGALYGIKLNEEIENPVYTIHGGAFIRMNDAIIPVIKLDYHPFSVSFSYDANISKLKTSSYGRGGFELSVSYIGFSNRNNSSVNYMRCPRF